MERFCNKCGSLVSGDVKFCPSCGEPMQGAVDLGKATAMPPVQQPVDQNSYGYSVPQYGQNIAASSTESKPATTGQWVGTILLCTFFGLISFILCIVWGFGSTTPEPKRSFCRAMFIIYIIAMALSTIASIIMIAVFGNELFEFIEQAEKFGYGWAI